MHTLPMCIVRLGVSQCRKLASIGESGSYDAMKNLPADAYGESTPDRHGLPTVGGSAVGWAEPAKMTDLKNHTIIGITATFAPESS
jgi:hypothetical protein